MRSFFVALCLVVFVAGCSDKKTEPAQSESEKVEEDAKKLATANKKLEDELDRQKKLLQEQAALYKLKQDAVAAIAKEKDSKALIRIEAEEKISEIQAKSDERVSGIKVETDRKVSDLQREIRDLKKLYFQQKNSKKAEEIMREADDKTAKGKLLVSKMEAQIKEEKAKTAAQIKKIRLEAGIIGFFP